MKTMHIIKTDYKRGVAMIELIFAMVIIGIVLLSAPMLIHQSSQSNSVALQQEAIAAIASHTGIILTKHWDEADANLTGGIAPILTTDAGAMEFDFNASEPRVGMKGIRSGRLLTTPTGDLVPASAIGTDINDTLNNTRNDIDDYHDSNTTLTIYNGEVTSASEGDYVDVNLNIYTEISYVNDAPTTFTTTSSSSFNETIVAGSSNIKFIKVRLTTTNDALNTTSELNKNIVLKAFSCNLGTTVPQGDQKEP